MFGAPQKTVFSAAAVLLCGSFCALRHCCGKMSLSKVKEEGKEEMNYIVSANTDIGTVKNTNQDSLSVKVFNTPIGRMSFAVLCDGMGGLAKGEVAAASVIRAFDEWARNELPRLCGAPLDENVIRAQWEKLLLGQNGLIKSYGARQGVRLGTTAVVLLLTDTRYFIANVGDSRAYEITDTVTQLTTDQTFVAREVALGNMTPEQAETDARRSVLLQCIGASEEVFPEFIVGEAAVGATYMLCSDGFRHEITAAEIFEKFQPGALMSATEMDRNAVELIELNKQRSERDNISVALIRTF